MHSLTHYSMHALNHLRISHELKEAIDIIESNIKFIENCMLSLRHIVGGGMYWSYYFVIHSLTNSFNFLV